MDQRGEPNDPVLRELLGRCRRDHLAWINGDGSPYELPDDGTIMGAMGGFSVGGLSTLERQIATARRWSAGRGHLEYVNGGAGDGFAWLAMLERGTATIDGKGADTRWDLRVTEVFRRSADGWERVHRHADPFVDRREVLDVLPLLE